MSARVWWRLSGGLLGKITERYHVLNDTKTRTLCGILMPESFGRFGGDSAREQAKRRCSVCWIRHRTARESYDVH